MFKPYPRGSSMMVGEEDLAIKVYIPPTGFVWNHDKGVLERTEIICRSSIKKEQYWERPKWPDNYIKKVVREKELQKSDFEYVDPELKEFREREWHRRLYGAWFMNNGKYVYLTGPYYFYLAHWIIDVGPPSFKLADLHKAYFWQYCVEDPCCYGMLEMTKRRVGKTYFGACMLYEYVSRTANAHAGIQSKTGSDAKLVFTEKLIQPWRKLIDFFRPDYDKSKGDVPKTELRFFKTSSKGSKVINVYDDTAELESWVDFQNSGTHAYDSQKMLRYLCDEIFKTIEADIITRHGVIKPCLENESGEIIGKAIYTSTVEEIEGHIQKYVELWDESNFNEKNENGRTKTGLYRFFTPAQKIMFVDKYGIPDEKRALAHIENEIAGLTDPRAISAYRKKNPRTWQEAFKYGSDKCLFDPVKLNDRFTDLALIKEELLFEQCNLIWDETVPEDEIPRVKLVKNSNGRFRFAWKFSDALQASDVVRRGSQFLPKNFLRFVIGVDPFDHNRTKDGKFSMGAAAVYMKYDPFNPDLSENFVAYYCGRPSNSAIFYEDILKLCHYFSCQMLFEDNKPKIGDYFVDRGYGAFLMRDDKGHPGVSASQKTHQVLAEHIESFIDEHCHRVKFIDMLKDWLKLDLDDTTACDLGMATGYTLMAASRILRKEKFLSKMKKASPSGLIRKYKIRNGIRKGISLSKLPKQAISKFSKSFY
jgi:hypothetical protein